MFHTHAVALVRVIGDARRQASFWTTDSNTRIAGDRFSLAFFKRSGVTCKSDVLITHFVAQTETHFY